MPKVMIQPATYKNVRQAVGRAFELFPLTILSTALVMLEVTTPR